MEGLNESKNKVDIATRYPIVALIGRPNVGKSTLFNRLLGKRRAITDPTPGVTRDALAETWNLYGHFLTLVDSGGIKDSEEELDKAVRERSLSLLEKASVILFLMDVTEITSEDEIIIKELRKFQDKVILVVNKVDDEDKEDLVWNYYRYGFEVVLPISASHARGIEDLEEEILSKLKLEKLDEEESVDESIKLLIMGKPNTGKSTLINLLTGREVSIVSPIAGTTRDFTKGSFSYKGKDFTVIDTAGIRRKSKVEEDVEYYSVNRAIKAIDESDVVLLMIDAVEGLAEQDKKIANLIVRRGKGIILVLNKIDTLFSSPGALDAALDRIRFLFPLLSFAPSVGISALYAEEIGTLLDTVNKVWKELNKRVGTGELNTALKTWQDSQSAPRGSEGHFKVQYGTQISSNPVRFLFFVNRITNFPETYISYLKNSIRSTFGLKDIPVDISLRERKRSESNNTKGEKRGNKEINRILNEKNSKAKPVKKGISRKPGGKARINKELEKAKKIVRNSKQRVKSEKK